MFRWSRLLRRFTQLCTLSCYLFAFRAIYLTWSERRPPASFTSSIHAFSEQEVVAQLYVEEIANFQLSPPNADPEEFEIAICAVPTHELKFLAEWITWHRLIGVERFHLFDNSPSQEMREFLRPWLEEGSVILYDLLYEDPTSIGLRWQDDLIQECDNRVVSVAKWVSHFDVDEFIMVDSPGWTSPVPYPSEGTTSLTGWATPLRAVFEGAADKGQCVPMSRITFSNLGKLNMSETELVTQEHIVRETLLPGRFTYGKVWLHSRGVEGRPITDGLSWNGPHVCDSPQGEVVDVYGAPLPNPYPAAGVPLPLEGLRVFHYPQRSLQNCFNKVDVLKYVPDDWRSRHGKEGCADMYLPLDSEADPSSPKHQQLRQRQFGDRIVHRDSYWMGVLVADTTARDSWPGRMTRVIVDEWLRRGHIGPPDWSGKNDTSGDIPNIITINVDKPNWVDAVLVEL